MWTIFHKSSSFWVLPPLTHHSINELDRADDWTFGKGIDDSIPGSYCNWNSLRWRKSKLIKYFFGYLLLTWYPTLRLVVEVVFFFWIFSVDTHHDLKMQYWLAHWVSFSIYSWDDNPWTTWSYCAISRSPNSLQCTRCSPYNNIFVFKLES